jgi:hypothetical protein
LQFASCGSHGCTYRFGGRWIAQRLAGQREPALRARARSPLVQVIEAQRGEEQQLLAALRPPAMPGLPSSPLMQPHV